MHETRINGVCERGENMVEAKHFALLDIQVRKIQLFNM